MKRDELLALAGRCEREVPSRELDADIYIAVRIPSERAGRIDKLGGVVGWWPKDGPYQSAIDVPCFTTSMDAALTLVPDAKQAELSEMSRHVDWGEAHPVTGSHEREYCVSVYLLDEAGYATGMGLNGAAETLPLALCAAALKARAALVLA